MSSSCLPTCRCIYEVRREKESEKRKRQDTKEVTYSSSFSSMNESKDIPTLTQKIVCCEIFINVYKVLLYRE
jgi:hypothetical protein